MNVNVVTPGGTTNNETYTYVVPAPTLTNLNPSSGPTAGGNNVTLTGTNFNNATGDTVSMIDVATCNAADTSGCAQPRGWSRWTWATGPRSR